MTNPTEVRHTLDYILGNTRKHAAQVGRILPPDYRDPYTVGYFGERIVLPAGTAAMVAPPESWLLVHGWKRTAATAAPAGGEGSGMAASGDRHPSRKQVVARQEVLALFSDAPPGASPDPRPAPNSCVDFVDARAAHVRSPSRNAGETAGAGRVPRGFPPDSNDNTSARWLCVWSGRSVTSPSHARLATGTAGGIGMRDEPRGTRP